MANRFLQVQVLVRWSGTGGAVCGAIHLPARRVPASSGEGHPGRAPDPKRPIVSWRDELSWPLYRIGDAWGRVKTGQLDGAKFKHVVSGM